MKLLTRNTDYAIRAVCFLAKKEGEVVTASEVVRSLKVPRPFIRKIMQTLNGRKIIRSARGAGGGFILARSPDLIYIKEIAGIFQGPFNLNECTLKKRPCPNRQTCPLKRRIDKIEKYVDRELGSLTISDLLKG